MNILIAQPNTIIRNELGRVARRVAPDADVRFCATGTEAVELCETFQPDAAIIDEHLAGVDGYHLVEEVFGKKTAVVLLINMRTDFSSKKAMRLGVRNILVKPFTLDSVEKRLREALEPPKEPACTRNIELERAVSALLIRAGVSVKSKGYRQLKEGVLIALQDMTALDKLTQRIYCEVARRTGGNWQAAERNMRTAIENAFLRGNIYYLQELFGCTIDSSKGKPTNGEFIAMVVDRIRLDMIAGGVDRYR